MRKLGAQRGQATVVTVLFLLVLLGITAAVLDVGRWFREDRDLQADVDAAALAGAQALPDDPAVAVALALEYSAKNGGGVEMGDISFEASVLANDTIVIQADRLVDGTFTKLFGIDSADAKAAAKARAANPSSARWAAPIAVDIKHPLLSGGGCPCFNEETELDLLKVGPGAFRLVNIDGSHGGTGPGTLAQWIRQGYDGYMPVDWYFSDPGAKFNSSQVKDALDDRTGDVLLFPVYDETIGGGANFEYHVIGWVGFRLARYEIQGSKKNKLYGHFESITWEGIQSQSASASNFGIRVISLIE